MPGPSGYGGQIAAELDQFRSRGSKQASKNLPPSDAARLDEHESELKALAEKWIAEEHSLFDVEIVEANRVVTDIEQKTVELEAAVVELTSELPLASGVEPMMAAERMHLIGAAQRRLVAEAELRYFKVLNHVTEHAIYPPSPVWHFALVALCWLVESGANAFFYENSQGLFGGLIVAFLVGLVNMSTAVALGYAFRYHNLAAYSRKIIGWGAIVVYATSTVYLNALFAAFRSTYQTLTDPTDIGQLRSAFALAIESALGIFKAHLPVGDFMSFMLWLLGLGLSIFAFFKGYTFDDKYPGHSGKEQRFEAAKIKEHALRDELRLRIQAVSTARTTAVQGALRAPSGMLSLCSKRIAELQHTQSAVKARVDAIARDYRLVLDAYRHSNMAVRTTQRPEYFTEYPTLAPPPDNRRADDLIERLRTCQNEIRKTQEASQSQLNQLLDSLQKQTSEILNASFPAFLRSVDAQAEEKLNKEAQTVERVKASL